MIRNKLIPFLLLLALVFAFLIPVASPQEVWAKVTTSLRAESALAQQASPPDKIEISSSYPILQGYSGQTFSFDIDLKYEGKEARTFALAVKGPPEWSIVIQPGFGREEAREISAIRLEPKREYPERVKLVVYPPARKLPQPGEYTISLAATSGEVSGNLELKAVITASYIMGLYSSSGRLNTTATTGKDNYFSLLVLNAGSAQLDNIEFNTDKPSDWTTTFTPHRIDTLAPGLKQEITLTIKVPDRTIAGDYAVAVTAETPRASEKLNLRVTVLTPTVWGWVGVFVVLVVIVGLGVVFVKLGRR